MQVITLSKFLTFFIVLFCLAGVLDSSLALREHYNTDTSPCSINAKWDCGTVNHSPYAVISGVPVALIGIMGYALLAALAGRLPWIAVACALAATVFSLRLTSIEWKDLRVWCLYCVISQVIIIAVLLLTSAQALLLKRAQSV